MKNLLKVGVLAMALGMFVAACNSGTNTGNANDSTNTEMSAPATSQPAPSDTMAPADTTGADTTKM
ncbi:MAG TPA: hypothetical protein VFX43_14395 [Chitinophagaceae bacterium]|nr:hypothetical protein [Chitinophagaceae bacterium]